MNGRVSCRQAGQQTASSKGDFALFLLSPVVVLSLSWTCRAPICQPSRAHTSSSFYREGEGESDRPESGIVCPLPSFVFIFPLLFSFSFFHFSFSVVIANQTTIFTLSLSSSPSPSPPIRQPTTHQGQRIPQTQELTQTRRPALIQS